MHNAIILNLLQSASQQQKRVLSDKMLDQKNKRMFLNDNSQVKDIRSCSQSSMESEHTNNDNCISLNSLSFSINLFNIV